ncbi:MFS transporter [Streptomyces sp. NPDC047023]|uniref:MFS transporter n=1 Tax=Streptomyces sp. NPDC047023 TaxID=3155139 RepID=UPI0033C08835
MIALAQLMVTLDATIVNVSLPAAQTDLEFSDASRPWVITSYALAFGALLLLGGRLGDVFGRRKVFLTGVAGFAAASALAGAASSLGVLVAGRGLQGVFAALLAPSALSLLSTTFTQPRERARAFSVFGTVAGTGGAVGLLLGGVLTDTLSWRWTLYINVPIAVAVWLGGIAVLSRQGKRAAGGVDAVSALLAAGGLFNVVFGLSNAEVNGWGHILTWGSMANGVVVLALFVRRQGRTAQPLLPLRIVKDRDRGASLIAVATSAAGMFSVLLFLTYYLQLVHGLSPTMTGIAFLPLIAALMAATQIAARWVVPFLGVRWTVPTGLLLQGVGLMDLAALDSGSGYGAVLPGLLLFGAGMGLVMPTSMSTGTARVAAEDAGAASATINTAQQVGGAAGVALLSTVAASASASFAASHPSSALPAQAAGYSAAFAVAAKISALGAVVTAVLYRSSDNRRRSTVVAAAESRN